MFQEEKIMATFQNEALKDHTAARLNRSPRTPYRKPVPATAQPKETAARTFQSEAALIARLQAGEEKAFEAIFNKYSPKLYNVAQRILGEPADAQEVIQEVFLTVFRKANTFQGNSQFSTWLYRLTVNEALGKIRKSKNKQKEVEYEEFLPKFQDDGHHAVRPVVDWSDTVEEQYAGQELRQLLSEALNQLKPVDKSVVVLSDVEGMSDKEIAEILNLTVSAVKTRLHRARLFLRGKLAVDLGYSAA